MEVVEKSFIDVTRVSLRERRSSMCKEGGVELASHCSSHARHAIGVSSFPWNVMGPRFLVRGAISGLEMAKAAK